MKAGLATDKAMASPALKPSEHGRKGCAKSSRDSLVFPQKQFFPQTGTLASFTQGIGRTAGTGRVR